MSSFKRNILYRAMMLSALLLVPYSAFAAGTVSVTRQDGSVFKLIASGVDGSAGYDITLGFDSARFSNPRVTLGSAASGAILATNAGLPGTLHIALIKPTAMSGNGAIATVTFDQTGDGPGAITVVKGKAINVNAADLHARFYGWSPSDAVAQSPADPPADPPAVTPVATTTNTTATAPAATPVTVAQAGAIANLGAGTITMPGDDPGAGVGKEEPGQPQAGQPQAGQPQALQPGQPLQPLQQGPHDAATAPTKGAEMAAEEVRATSKSAAAKLPRPQQSVLEKFRLFTGEKTPAKLIALFNREQDAPFSQIPAICLADDKATVRVALPNVSGGKAPLFILGHASYLGLEQADNGEWQVAVRPDQGALRATVTVITGDLQQEIPLTVAPKAEVDLNGSGTLSEADFQLFLKTRGSAGAPLFDLNGDGKRDYVDDYIFTANYLAKKGALVGKDALAQQKGR